MAIIFKTYTLPDSYAYDSNSGWNAGANSLALLDNNASYSFTIPGVPAGVVTGISDPESNKGFGYYEIEYAFYISNGGYRVVESGVFKTPPVACPADTRFTIAHIGTRVLYFVEGVLVYTSTLPAPLTFMVVDASLYSAGDSIADAEINDVYVATAPITTSSTLAAQPTITNPMTAEFSGSSTLAAGITVDGKEFIGAAFTGSSTFSAEMSTISQFEVAFTGASTVTVEQPRVHNDGGDTAFEALTTFGSNYESTRSATSFEPLEGGGDSGFLQPTIANSYTAFAGLDTIGRVLTGGLITGTEIPLPKLDSLGSDFPYGESETSFFGFTSRSGEYILVDGVLVGNIPSTSLNAVGISQLENGLSGDIPEVSIQAYAGSRAVLTAPVVSIQGSGTVPNVGRLDKSVPLYTLTASGVVGAVSTLDKTYNLNVTGNAYGGGYLRGEIPKISTQSVATTGAVGTITASAPKITLTATGSDQNYGTAYLQVPEVSTLYGALYGTVPVVFTTTEDIAVLGEGRTYAVNTLHYGVTEYTNYNFDHMFRFNGIYYGIAGGEIYEMVGDTDAGVLIPQHVTLPSADLGSSSLKRLSNVYVGGRADSALKVTPTADERALPDLYAPAMDRQGTHTRRIRTALGPKARYWGVTVANTNGDALSIESIELEITKLSRRI